jgi:hypothetical protein
MRNDSPGPGQQSIIVTTRFQLPQVITVTDNIAPFLVGVPANVSVDCAAIPTCSNSNRHR